MDTNQLRLTSSEIGSLWGIYINGTMTDVVSKYMYSIIEDTSIKAVFEDGIQIFEKQKQQMMTFFKNEGFPIPLGFTEKDLIHGAGRLFTDIFCLNYLHIMTLHGMLGHSTALGVAVRKDLREFYDSCDNDVKRMYHRTIELLLEKGSFQRDPLFYPTNQPEFITSKEFIGGLFGKSRRLSATEIISISFNLKKSIMAKTLAIGFSQVAKNQGVRELLSEMENVADDQIKAFSKIMHNDNLPIQRSWETEVTTSTTSPFSDKLIMYHAGFLFQAAQAYHGTGLASAMRTDLVAAFETAILKTLMVTKKWFNLMVKHQWMEQPPLAPNREELVRDK